MRRLFIPVLTLGLVTFLAIGCDALGGEDTGGTVILKGRVVNGQTGAAVTGALVTAQARGGAILGRSGTDSLGLYDLAVEIDSSMQVFVTAEKDGRNSDERSPFAEAGATITVSDLQIQGIEAPEPKRGTPAYIQFVGAEPQNIQVQETGGTEVTRLTFAVKDSANRSISLNYQTGMRFSLRSHPGGGERLTTNQTDVVNGKATVSLISGDSAGVVQVYAELDRKDGQVISSKPVAISIYGGFPDRKHFTVAVEKFNFAGLSRAFLENKISVLVGDKHSNPVIPGTAVYLETTGGVIGNIAEPVLTNAKGQGSTTLMSGNPLPERGIAHITGRTVNGKDEAISRTVAVVFSGAPILRINSTDGDPREARLGQSYTLTVVDRNGNPLAPGTSIQVRAEGDEVEVSGADATGGDVNVTLKNTPFVDQNGDGDAIDYEDVVRGFGTTQFRFKPIEDPNIEEEGVPVLKGLTITVSGQGGSASCSIDTDPTQTNCTVGTITSAQGGGEFVVRGEAPRR